MTSLRAQNQRIKRRKFLSTWIKTGGNISKAGQVAGLPRSNLYRWFGKGFSKEEARFFFHKAGKAIRNLSETLIELNSLNKARLMGSTNIQISKKLYRLIAAEKRRLSQIALKKQKKKKLSQIPVKA